MIVVLVLAVAGIVVGVSRSSAGFRTVAKFVTGTPEPDGSQVQLDTTLYLPDSTSTPKPAVASLANCGGASSGVMVV